jgi:hypothetical protein
LLSPIALRVPLHHADAVADHEPAGRLLGDRSRERGEGQVERASDRQRLVVVALDPFLDVASSSLGEPR